MHVLVVEDNNDIAENIKKFLELDDFVVDLAFDWNEWFEKFQNKEYDIVLLDIMMPKMDWIQLCGKIRELRSVPIIMLTAKWQLEDKMQWFDCGADDYLVKPFDLPELLMRMKALLKRTQAQDLFNFGDVTIDLEAKTVLKAGLEIKLTIKEWMILTCLLDWNGVVVSRWEILDFVWGEDLFENGDKLDVYISNLRKKLGKDLIITMKWYGYKIENK